MPTRKGNSITEFTKTELQEIGLMQLIEQIRVNQQVCDDAKPLMWPCAQDRFAVVFEMCVNHANV